METTALRRAVRWVDRWLTSAGRRSCTGRSQEALRDTLASAAPSAGRLADPASPDGAPGADRPAPAARRSRSGSHAGSG